MLDLLLWGGEFTIEKDGMRIMPFLNPMELSTSDHKYIAKIVVNELRIVADKTFVTFEVLKLFDENEQKIYTDNFIRPDIS